MMDEMSVAQFREWIAFDSLEPIGRDRTDVPIAILAWLVASIGGGKKLAGDVEQWLPKWAQPKPDRPQTGDEMAAKMRERLAKIR